MTHEAIRFTSSVRGPEHEAMVKCSECGDVKLSINTVNDDNETIACGKIKDDGSSCASKSYSKYDQDAQAAEHMQATRGRAKGAEKDGKDF